MKTNLQTPAEVHTIYNIMMKHFVLYNEFLKVDDYRGLLYTS